MNKEKALELACELFYHWATELDNGELRDLLLGNNESYRGMPNINRFLSDEKQQEIIIWRDKE